MQQDREGSGMMLRAPSDNNVFTIRAKATLLRNIVNTQNVIRSRFGWALDKFL